MRMLWGTICLALLAFPANARPSPPPPSDFQGDIYVDDRGCVFNRDEHNWVERKVDGRQICGFPPSLSLRIETQEAVRPPSMIQVEKDLLGSLASELRQGELVADERSSEYIEEAPPAYGQDKFTADLTSLVKHDASLQAAISGSFHANDICRRLGYRAELDPRPVLGWDVTMGLCPAARSTTPRERVLFGKRLENIVEKAKPTASNTGPAITPKDKVQTPESSVESAARPPVSKAEKTRPPVRRVSKPSQPESAKPVIAAGDPVPAKKYVEIGIYRDDQSAERAISGLARMGYPAAQAYRREDRETIRIIYAGPFSEQPALMAALTTLRGAGYAQANIR